MKKKKTLIQAPAVIETLMGFLLLVTVNYFFFSDDPGFLGFKQLHPYMIPVLLIAGRYGFGAGIFSGCLAALLYSMFFFHEIPSRLEIEQALEGGFLWLPLTFMGTGLVFGEIRQGFLRREETALRDLKEKSESLENVLEWYKASEESKRVLEARIVGQASTVKMLYQAARKLESLKPEEVYRGCLDILAEHFQVKKASLFLLEGNYFTLKAALGWEEGSEREGKVKSEESLMGLALEENRMLTVTDMIRKNESARFSEEVGKVMALYPITDEVKKARGVINIEDIEFFALNKVNLDLIGLVVDWTAQALQTLSLFEQVRSRMIMDDELKIFTHYYFEIMLEREFLRAQKYGLPLSVALIKIKDYAFMLEERQQICEKALSSLFENVLPKTAISFHYRFRGTYAVISPMEQDISAAMEKMREGISNIGADLLFGIATMPSTSSVKDDWLQPVLEELKLVMAQGRGIEP